MKIIENETIALYIRGLSDHSQEFQMTAAKNLLKECSYHQLLWFKDSSELHHTLAERPGIQRMLECQKKRKIHTLYVYDQSRISRNLNEYLSFLTALDSDIKVVFTSTGDTASISDLLDERLYTLRRCQTILKDSNNNYC